MARALRALITFYTTGRQEDREAYDIAWVQDKASPVDTINGFVEVYLDARSMKGAWEALVFYVNPGKTSEIRRIAEHAQWFEDRMPWDPKYRKEGVHGVTANAIDVVIETGDSGPITPVGINLPNDQAIRERYGSKSVSLSNVNEAYDKSTLPEFRSEFSWTPDEVERAVKWSAMAGELTTNMHEVIGHGSGKVDERLKGSPQTALKEQFSAIEESRADLVALYFLANPKLVELGLVPGDAHDDIVRAEYEGYTRNALVQLRRVREGSQIEEDHMRNRQLIAAWCYASLMDLIGNDINYSVSCSVYEQLNKPERLMPSSIQKEKVEKGELGKKTGKGYYRYN
jgi:dipeptidyl-peptidase-3